MKKYLIIISLLIITGCVQEKQVNNTIINTTNNITTQRILNYTFQVTIPEGNDETIFIAFTSDDVNWQLIKPMNQVNKTTWSFSMPAFWLPEGASKINYGYLRNKDLTNINQWINHSFKSNREQGIKLYDVINSWNNNEPLINTTFLLAVPYGTKSVKLIINNKTYELNGSGVAYVFNTKAINGSDYTYLIDGKEIKGIIKEVNKDYLSNETIMKGKGLTYGGMILSKNNLEEMKEQLNYVIDYGFNNIVLIPEWFIFPDYEGEEIKPYNESSGLTFNHNCFSYTISDDELISLINYAKSIGLNVALKPHIDGIDFCTNPESTRGGSHHSDWTEWINNYKKFIKHYATIANETNINLFFIGTELDSATISDCNGCNVNADADWRSIINLVRSVYKGPITYSVSCHGECTTPAKISFWDAVDYISIEPYFSLTNTLNPSINNMNQSFNKKLDSYAKTLSDKYGKKVILGEVNVYSFDGVNSAPLDGNLASTRKPDHAEQANYYESFFQSINNKDYIKSYYLWAGYLGSFTGYQPKDTYDPVFNKVGGQVIKKWQK